MERHPEVPFWVCVGDVADAEGRYTTFPSPLYFIKGNNENFDLLERAGHEALPHRVEENLLYIPNGQRIEIAVGQPCTGCLTVASLGGTHAPTMYDVRAADLPHPKKRTAKATEAADRRRHFVREEVEACRAMRGIDLFLSHEAPRPFRVRGLDAGKTPINDVLADMQPRLHLFGHHHRFADGAAQGVRSICLAAVTESYLLIDPKSLTCEHLPLH